METVRHDDRSTAYTLVDGDDPTLLFVHGSGCTHEVWRPQLDGLPYRMAALDLSGHGGSDDISAEPGTGTLKEYVRDVEAVAREVDADVLVGNSLGGAVTMQTYLDGNLDLEGLVLTDTSADFLVMDEVLEMTLQNYENMIRWSHQNGFVFHSVDDDLLDWSIEMMLECGSEVMHRDFKTCDEFDVRDRLGEFGVPVLVVVGEDDKLTPPDFNRDIAESVPDGRYLEIPDCGHMSMLEAPETLNDAVREFVSGL